LVNSYEGVQFLRIEVSALPEHACNIIGHFLDSTIALDGRSGIGFGKIGDYIANVRHKRYITIHNVRRQRLWEIIVYTGGIDNLQSERLQKSQTSVLQVKRKKILRENVG